MVGIYTGYFENLKIQNETKNNSLQALKTSLETQIQIFTEKRDTLNARNIMLSRNNDKLIDTTSKLQVTLKEFSLKDKLLSNQTQLLTKKIFKKQKDMDSLANYNNQINIKIVQSEKNLKQASFKYSLREILKTPHVYSDLYSNLLNLLIMTNENQRDYIDTIIRIIDTCQNITQKGILYRLIYETLGDNNWRKKLYILADSICETLKDNRTNHNFDPFWAICTFDNNYHNLNEKIENVRFLTDLVRKLGSNIYDIKDILINIGFMELHSNFRLNLYKVIPDEFCYLVNKSVDFCLSRNTILDFGCYYFLENCAPLALVSIIPEIMRQNNQNQSEITILQTKAINIIEKNKNILDPPSNMKELNSWERWERNYPDLLNRVLKINSICDKPVDLEKIIGNHE